MTFEVLKAAEDWNPTSSRSAARARFFKVSQ